MGSVTRFLYTVHTNLLVCGIESGTGRLLAVASLFLDVLCSFTLHLVAAPDHSPPQGLATGTQARWGPVGAVASAVHHVLLMVSDSEAGPKAHRMAGSLPSSSRTRARTHVEASTGM